MTIIPTNQWLKQYLVKKTGVQNTDFKLQQDLLCAKPLHRFFPDATPIEIQQHLLQNGLFLPGTSDQTAIEQLCNKPYWELAEKEMEHLKQEWSGPDVPVLIFPANLENEQLRIDFKGRSGLSYHDKIFLFISGETSETAFRALLTHEYNHVCRLNFLQKSEHDITLLDTMVMEGLAEAAVLERLGNAYAAPWTCMYSLTDARSYWEKWLKSALHTKRSHFRLQLLMYGGQSIPKWLGYNVGFQLVQSSIKNTSNDMQKILQLSTEYLYSLSAFK